MPRVTSSKEIDSWQAQDDARTLCEAEKIKKDSKRMSAAAKQAEKMAQEKMDQAKAMRVIAKRGKK